MTIAIRWPWLPRNVRGFGGVWPFILLHPGYYHNEALRQHEKCHNRQCLKGWFIGFWLMYGLSKKARYRYELEAYKVSAKYGRPVDECARALYSTVGWELDLTYAKVRAQFEDR